MLVRGSASRSATSRWPSPLGINGAAVAGMICISPTAPRGDTARSLKPDSTAISALISSLSTPWRAAASRTQGCTRLTSGAISSQVRMADAEVVLPGTLIAAGAEAAESPITRL